MVEKRERRRRDGSTYAVWRVRWYDETSAERSKTFDRATDAKAFEAKIRTLKRTGALADIDAGSETLAEFVEEWWLVYAGPNLERSTLRVYAQLWNGHALPRLGQVRLRDLTPQTVARFRAELEAAWRRRRGDPQDDDDAPKRAAARGRMGPRPEQRGQGHPQAAQAAPPRRSGDPAVTD